MFRRSDKMQKGIEKEQDLERVVCEERKDRIKLKYNPNTKGYSSYKPQHSAMGHDGYLKCCDSRDCSYKLTRSNLQYCSWAWIKKYVAGK
jgi:hypothetical protein